MQNLVLLIEPSKDASVISLKGGNMCMNRFCINEEAAVESSGVHYLKKPWYKMSNESDKFEVAKESKGKGYLSL